MAPYSFKHLDGSPKSVITETFVVYEYGDIVGYVLGLITLIPIFVLVSYATRIFCQRDFHAVFMLAGQIASLIVNKVLKVVINESRPPDTGLLDSGMPSNHSQFIGFFCAYAVSHLITSNGRKYWSNFERSCCLIGLVVGGTLVCFSRIYLKYHTTPQVIVGAFVGVVTGISWQTLYNYYGQELGDKICGLKIFQLVGLANYNATEEYFKLRKKGTA